MARDYEVQIPALREGARRFADDEKEVTGARDDGSRAALDAARSVNGGLLTGASNRLAASITSAAGGVSTALGEAGTTLTSNADRYQGDDSAAHDRLQAVRFDAGPW